MAYTSKQGRRPNEYASKSAHSYIVNDSSVKKFLEQCNFPPNAENISLSEHLCLDYELVSNNPIRHIFAVDGGYTEIPVQTEFPSATIAFFQFGALTFSIADLDDMETQPFIDPDDMSKLKDINRLKLTIPVRNMSLMDESTLTNSIRKTLYNFFEVRTGNESLMDTLRWFIFQEYDKPISNWILANCPTCRTPKISLHRSKMTNNHQFRCENKNCGAIIYLTDVFRLHEAIDDEMGAGGILGYLTTTIEQIIIIHLIRLLLKLKPSALKEVLFIKDGPLAFFGQTANMHRPMRELVKFLFNNYDLFLAGLEKSGSFVEHADEIAKKMGSGRILILDNDYIYRYILPGKADPANPYGRTSYYSNKIIFKTTSSAMYVVSLPTIDIIPYPTKNDFKNLSTILNNLEKLKCDMYDSALVPIALVNKLISLSDHPSSKILQRFATNSLSNN